MTEALAGLGDADQVKEIKLLAHSCKQLEGQVHQAGLVDRGPSHWSLHAAARHVPKLEATILD
jgi:hypothetical protein